MLFFQVNRTNFFFKLYFSQIFSFTQLDTTPANCLTIFGGDLCIQATNLSIEDKG